MKRALAIGCVSLFLAQTGSTEWVISGDAKAAGVRRQTLAHTSNVQPWFVDTVTGATQKVEARSVITEAGVFATYLEADTARTFGLRYVGAHPSFSGVYDHFRLGNLVLAWRGAAGALEGGAISTPSHWGQGLLLDHSRFSGIRARLEWNTQAVTEALWTDTLEDPGRYLYYKDSISGVRHVARFDHGEIGLAVLDTSQAGLDPFPKQNVIPGTYWAAEGTYCVHPDWQMTAEAGWASLLQGNRAQAGAGTAAACWTGAPGWEWRFGCWYQGQGFHPVTGAYDRLGDEVGSVWTQAGWTGWGPDLEINPGCGWKRRRGEHYLVPKVELAWTWPASGLFVQFYESAEQPAGRWGAEDHWEHSRALLGWQAFSNAWLSAVWEKTYDGFSHLKVIQLSAEVRVKY